MIDVFSPLVYGPMSLIILGFGEAASRRREHRAFYLIAAAVVSAVFLAEVGWAAHGAVVCGEDRGCTEKREACSRPYSPPASIG